MEKIGDGNWLMFWKKKMKSDRLVPSLLVFSAVSFRDRQMKYSTVCAFASDWLIFLKKEIRPKFAYRSFSAWPWLLMVRNRLAVKRIRAEYFSGLLRSFCSENQGRGYWTWPDSLSIFIPLRSGCDPFRDIRRWKWNVTLSLSPLAADLRMIELWKFTSFAGWHVAE